MQTSSMAVGTKRAAEDDPRRPALSIVSQIVVTISPTCRPRIRSAASKLYRSHTEPVVCLAGAKEASTPVLPVLTPDPEVVELGIVVGVVPPELDDGVTVAGDTPCPPVGNTPAGRNVLPLVRPMLFAPALRVAIIGPAG